MSFWGLYACCMLFFGILQHLQQSYLHVRLLHLKKSAPCLYSIPGTYSAYCMLPLLLVCCVCLCRRVWSAVLLCCVLCERKRRVSTEMSRRYLPRGEGIFCLDAKRLDRQPWPLDSLTSTDIFDRRLVCFKVTRLFHNARFCSFFSRLSPPKFRRESRKSVHDDHNSVSSPEIKVTYFYYLYTTFSMEL